MSQSVMYFKTCMCEILYFNSTKAFAFKIQTGFLAVRIMIKSMGIGFRGLGFKSFLFHDL